MSTPLVNESRELARSRVELKFSFPKIRRRLDVPTDLTLLDLNDVIQAAFLWDHSHLWRFNVGDTRYVDTNLIDWGDDSLIDAADIDLRALVKKQIRKFSYTYEFGDDWIRLISIYERSPKP